AMFHSCFSVFFFIDTATTEIYTLSLHDALPISSSSRTRSCRRATCRTQGSASSSTGRSRAAARRATSSRSSPPPRRTCASTASRSEEHTSELQSLAYLVCRLLLEKKKASTKKHI